MGIAYFFIPALLLLGLGIVLLIASLFPIKKLINYLPDGPLRKNWYLLAGLTLFFLLGYLCYGFFYWNSINKLTDLIVPCIFFLGACFVWLISSLSLQTAIDVRRVSRLEQETITDPLTGIYNRRHLERRLEEEFNHARQSGSELSILLIDIDHFKEINDTYGHAVGDLVIKDLAKLIGHFVRHCDFLARFGGDEFVVIALNTSAADAVTFAEHIIRFIEIQDMTLGKDDGEVLQIKTTISIGIASLDESADSYQHLFRNADNALYNAKHKGRNRADVYSNPA